MTVFMPCLGIKFRRRPREGGTGTMKECTYCGETIQEAARICRFCRMELETGKPVDRFPAEIRIRLSFLDGVRYGLGGNLLFLILLMGAIAAAAFGVMEYVDQLIPDFLKTE